MSQILWKPTEEQIKNTNMYLFMKVVNQRFGLSISEYDALYRWSVDHLSDFWGTFWDFAGIKALTSYDQVIDNPNKMPGAKWFSGARLNFAENLLRYRNEQIALIFRGEDHERRVVTYGELYDEVSRLTKALRDLGIQPGDRITGFMPNMPETIIAMLAAVSLGAVWSSCSPDFGSNGVLDRFGQIKPRVLFTADGYWFKGNRLDSLERVSRIIREIPSIEKVVVVPYTVEKTDIGFISNAIHYT